MRGSSVVVMPFCVVIGFAQRNTLLRNFASDGAQERFLFAGGSLVVLGDSGRLLGVYPR